MSIVNQYSVAICPPKSFSDQIAAYKSLLSREIGWNSGKTSNAHIVLNVFRTDAQKLKVWKRYLRMQASRYNAFRINFDSYNYLKSNYAFFLEPDKDSYERIREIMLRFHDSAPLSAFTNSNPHVSLGRRLNPEKIAKALALLPKEPISFRCDGLSIQKLDPQKGKYEIITKEFFNRNM